MKIVIQVILVVSTILMFGCGNNSKEKKTETSRHEKSAKAYLEQGQIKAAILEAKKIIQIEPEGPIGYIVLAKIYNKMGAYSAVQNLLEAVVVKMPELSTELAESYVLSKKYQSAISVMNTYPVDGQNSLNLQRQASLSALAYFYLGNSTEYAKMLDKFSSLGGNKSERQYIEVKTLLATKQVDEAQKILENLLLVTPEDTKALVLLGEVSFAKQELDKAENYLSKALSLLPNADIMNIERARVLELLTEVLISQGRTTEAYVYQKILAEENPESHAAQERFKDAIKFYQQENFSAAEAILKDLRVQFPDDKNSATLLGMIEFQKGENDNAASLFDEFIDAETSAPTVIQAAALVKYRKNQVDEALVLLKNAAESQPGNATILATYGLALLDQDNKSSEASVYLEKSLAINPSQQRLRLALAKRYGALGEPGQAIAQLNKAYKEAPLDIVLQEAYLKALFANGQADKVKQEADLFKEQFPDHSRGFFIEGWYFMEQKNYALAEKAFERALSLPSNSEKILSYTGLAQLYEIQKQTPKAIAAWQRAIEADPTVAASYGHWLHHMLADNKNEQAINFLLGIENKNALAWQPSAMLARLYADKKQWTEAEKHVDYALSRSASSDNVKKIAAVIYQSQGLDYRSANKLREARNYFLKAIKLAPENVEYLANMIETEIADHKIDEAQKLLNEYPQNENNINVRQFFQGAIRLAENKPDEAIKLFLQSWQSKPTEAAASTIFEYYEKNTQQEQLNKFSDAWVQALPKSAKGAMFKAMQAQKVQDDNAAIKWYEKTLELSPNTVIALNNLAWLYYVHKDERALSLAKRAFTAAPNSSPILDTYGWILVERGDVKSGIALLERAVSLSGNDEDIKNHLKNAKLRAH